MLLLEGNPERSAIFCWSPCPNEGNSPPVQCGVWGKVRAIII